MMTAYFFGAKAYFFATAKNRPANRKQSLQIYHKVLGEKIGGSHKCVFLVPVHLKSFTISVLQFQQKNIVHLLNTYIYSHSGDSFLNSSGVQFFVKILKSQKLQHQFRERKLRLHRLDSSVF